MRPLVELLRSEAGASRLPNCKYINLRHRQSRTSCGKAKPRCLRTFRAKPGCGQTRARVAGLILATRAFYIGPLSSDRKLRVELLDFFFINLGRGLDEGSAGHLIAAVRFDQPHALGAAPGLADAVGLNANQFSLLRDDHDF